MSIHYDSVRVVRPGHLGGSHWQLSKLNRINVLLGRNGSGKSLLLRALRDTDPKTFHYIVPERTGEIAYDATLVSRVMEPSGRREQSSANYQSTYRQAVVSRLQGYFAKRGMLDRDRIDHDPTELFRYVNIILPDFITSVSDKQPYFILQRALDGSVVTTVQELSSGESQLLTLGMDIMTMIGMWNLDQQEHRVLLLDEPDAHIHPDLQAKFASFLCKVANDYGVQLIVATHSMALMSAFGMSGAEQVSLLLLEPQEVTIRGEPLNRVRQQISSILGGHIVLGTLFAEPVLLVEGDDDYRVWLQVARSGLVRISVLPCNGDEIKNYQRTFERLLSALSDVKEMRGIALLDGDKALPRKNDVTQQYMPFMRLQCHETENLYLTDEVLAELGYDWKSASDKIAMEACNYGSKASELVAIVDSDRRVVDLKRVIHEIAEILDQKQLNWSYRLGKIIGKQKPTGMLAEFIGEELVSMLWDRNSHVDAVDVSLE